MSSRSTPSTRRDLGASLADAVSFSVMVGVGETYFAAFILALGKSASTAGLAASVPLLAGSVIQLISPYAIQRLGSLRRWIVWCATVQALTFALLCAGAAAGAMPTWALLTALALYWGAGQGTGPAWSTWIEKLVPARVRPRFFALRSRLAQLAHLTGLLAAGALLHWAAEHGQTFQAFMTLFVCAGAMRLISARQLARQTDAEIVPGSFERVSFVSFARRLRGAEDGRLLRYMLAVQIAVNVGAPFYAPYVLEHLGLPYGEYMALIASSLTVKVLVMPALGRLLVRVGARRVLWLGGLGMVPLPAMWIASDSFWVLLASQVLSGVSWAAYELAAFFLYFETIKSSQRTSLLTIFNLCSSVAMVVGTVVGATLLESAGSFVVLFAAASVARAATVVGLRRVHGVPLVEIARWPLRTSLATLERLVVPSRLLAPVRLIGGRRAKTEASVVTKAS